MPFNDKIQAYTEAEEKLLRARLDAIRAAIPPANRSEKGRSVELAVEKFFRELLPGEYGLTTGFIAYHSAECIQETVSTKGEETCFSYSYLPEKDTILVSSQLDLIIYDSIRFGPIMKLEGCDVLPFEGVYAYVEIKSWISNDPDKNGLTPLQSILKQSNRLRDIKVRLYWLSEPGKYTKAVIMPYPLEESVPIRSFVFILDTESSLSDFNVIKSMLEATEAKRQNGFLTSMYIQDKGYFSSYHGEEASDPKIGTIVGSGDDPLSIFKISLYSALARFPRADRAWTPAIDRYYYNTSVPSATVDLIKKKGEIPKLIVKIPEAQ